MRIPRELGRTLAGLALPRATAQACTDTFYEYRCICCGCSRSTSCRQRRSCKVCTDSKVRSAWTTIGGCDSACC